ncbi:MAG: nitroreductase family protein, partial [Oceanidesulfovibrio sp.]
CQAMVAVYHGQAPDTAPPAEPRGLEPIEDRQALSAASLTVAGEPEYPTIVAAHEAGAQAKAEDARPGPTMDAAALGLETLPAEPLSGAAELFAGRRMQPLAQTILSRRSQRRFVPEAPEQGTTHAFLRLLCERLEGGCDDADRTLATALVMGVGGETALYLLNRKAGSLARVQTTAERYPGGDLRAAVTEACLGQGWLARAAYLVIFLTDVVALESALGPRGYRRANLMAGRLGERAYLAANTLGMGACGVGAFFDSELSAVLGLGPGGRGLYIVAAGPCQPL